MRLLKQIKLMLLFLWDPEQVVSLPTTIHPKSNLLSPFILFFVLLFTAFLYLFNIAHLTCWTPKFYTPLRMGILLFSMFLVIWSADEFSAYRKHILLYGSLFVSLLASYRLVILSLAILIPYWFVVRLKISKYFKHFWVIFLYVIAMYIYSFKNFPEFVFDPYWGKAGIMWAFFLPLRFFWFHYQLTREHFKDFSLYEILLYFFLIPSPVIIPYMFALPRRQEIKKALNPTTHIKAQGILYIVAGLTFYVAYGFLDTTFNFISNISILKPLMIPWIYPLEPVFWALGSSYVITGLYNKVGAEVTLAFRSPLKSSSVLEWWRRWNVHFRDMLVDIFFYPFVLGKRKHPYLRLWFGVFGVFIVGSTFLHWIIKHYFMRAGFFPYYSMLVENTVMFFAVGILLHWERYNLEKRKKLRKELKKQNKKLPPIPQKPLWYRILAYPLTYFIVFISVVGGYASNLIIFGTYFDRPSVVMNYTEKLEKEGNLDIAKKYQLYAKKDFERIIAKYDDLSSPWRIKERHAAMKLALIYLQNNEKYKLEQVKHKLSWDNIPNNKLKSKINFELTKYKGFNGVKLLLKGKI